MNFRKALVLLTATLSGSFLFTARAELKWDQTMIELHPGVTDKQAVGHFKYENTGGKPVRFNSVKSSCGCTTAQTQREVVEPGEKGEITATFNIGDRTGTQIKTVTVLTDDPTHATTVLTLKAVLPEVLTINPMFVYWTANEEAKPKTISVKAGKEFQVKNLNVTCTNPEFLVKVDQVGNASEWKITIQPKETSRPMAGAVTIKPDIAAPRVYYANVSVTGGPAAPQPAAAVTH